MSQFKEGQSSACPLDHRRPLASVFGGEGSWRQVEQANTWTWGLGPFHRRGQVPRTQHCTGQCVHTVRLLSQRRRKGWRDGGWPGPGSVCIAIPRQFQQCSPPVCRSICCCRPGHTRPKAEVLHWAGSGTWGAGLPGCLAASAASHQRPRQHSNGGGIPSILMNDKCSRPTVKVSNTRLTTSGLCLRLCPERELG